MKIKIISALFFYTFSQFSFADLAGKPENCPSVASLQSVGVSQFLNQAGQWFGVVKSDSFDTNNKWTVVYGPYKAENEEDMNEQIADTLENLIFKMGPIPGHINNSWICAYQDDSRHVAAAITPELPLFQALYFLNR